MKNPVYWVVLIGISIALIQQDGSVGKDRSRKRKSMSQPNDRRKVSHKKADQY